MKNRNKYPIYFCKLNSLYESIQVFIMRVDLKDVEAFD